VKNDQIGVILLNLGGPENLSDVAPFLYNLFSDRDIIRLGPAWLQRSLARLIAYRRAAKSRKNYALIGGGSPLTRITLSQEQALQKALDAHGAFKVVTAMRYWKPRAKSALQMLATQGISKIIALPLYPHFSSATTGSSLTELKCELAALKVKSRLLEIMSWPDHPLYISCLGGYIQKGLAGLSDPNTSLVYSAHSLPADLVDRGDPYVAHLQRTIRAVESLTGHRGLLCFQSRSGPVRWLAPSTPETLDSLAAQGCKSILMVPISFVSDHVETLYEINILYRQKARDLGMRLEPTQSLNTDPVFIDCLRDLVVKKAEEFE
jgi:protoporphyrin/coproporphyrin ferrochelatase